MIFHICVFSCVYQMKKNVRFHECKNHSWSFKHLPIKSYEGLKFCIIILKFSRSLVDFFSAKISPWVRISHLEVSEISLEQWYFIFVYFHVFIRWQIIFDFTNVKIIVRSFKLFPIKSYEGLKFCIHHPTENLLRIIKIFQPSDI